MSVYLDCNATTPVEPEVAQVVSEWLLHEMGNAGSRTHEFGQRAKQAVERARERVAKVVDAQSDEVIFTSGATESNNLAIAGLVAYAERTGKKHLVSTAIEHKAVLEPLQALESRGFELTLVPVDSNGRVAASDVGAALRDDTLLVSVMHVNNETGVIQPIQEIADALASHEAYFHVDAAQGFGKVLDDLRSTRIDLLSASSHKVYGPIGVGALIARKRRMRRPPLAPLMVGGGQERGLRAGTLPVPLLVGFGLAAEIAVRDHRDRGKKNVALREEFLEALREVHVHFNSDPALTVPHTLSVAFQSVDSEALMLSIKDLISISNGSACTSTSYEPSHVLDAMQLPEERMSGTVRLSWCHMTPRPDFRALVERVRSLQP